MQKALEGRFILCNIKKGIDSIFNDNFCTHLLNFLIQANMTTSDFDTRGRAFFQIIEKWCNDYLLKKEVIQLDGIKGWYFDITATEFSFDFYSASQEQIEEYLFKIFLMCEFGAFSDCEYDYYMKKYDDEFFQKYYPEFQELFTGKEQMISDFEKNICDDFQFEFSKGCVVQLTKDVFTRELEDYERESGEKFFGYCSPENHSANDKVIDTLKDEYPRYHNVVAGLKADSGILQVFRINEHNCENRMFYLAVRKDSVCFLAIKDFM